jgi:hypothetical protein
LSEENDWWGGGGNGTEGGPGLKQRKKKRTLYNLGYQRVIQYIVFTRMKDIC